MEQETRQRWMDLCAQVAVEKDPKKVIALIQEINRILEVKERRLGIDPGQIDPKK